MFKGIFAKFYFSVKYKIEVKLIKIIKVAIAAKTIII